MLPCKDIVKLLSSQEDVSEIGWMRRAEIRLHLMMCKHCSRYARHLDMMKEGFKKLLTKITQTEAHEVEDLEREVLEKIRKQGIK